MSQVILAFFISAWLTYFVALFTYLFIDGVLDETCQFDYELRKIWEHGIQKLTGSRFTRIMTTIRNHVTKEQMQQVCLMFADQQLITGASVLIVAYLKHCDITQYHFYIAANLGLVSFASFQAVLLIVRDVLKSRVRKGWRMLWIFTIFSCILLLNFVFYNDNFLRDFGQPMRFLWRGLPGVFTPSNVAYVALGTILDVWALSGIVSGLYKLQKLPPLGVSDLLYYLMLQPTRFYLYCTERRHLSCQHSWTKRFLTLMESLAGILFITFFTLRELYCSMFINLTRIYIYLFQTTSSVYWARNQAATRGMEGEEDTWGFGQILPLLLLALPLFAFIEGIHGESLVMQRFSYVTSLMTCNCIMLTILDLEPTGSTTPAAPTTTPVLLTTTPVFLTVTPVILTTSPDIQTMRPEDPSDYWVDRCAAFEKQLYNKLAFRYWIFSVPWLLFAVVTSLSLTLDEGILI
jgi:hypothetical protein